MQDKNSMTLTFSSTAVNEAFARMAASAFIMPLDPTVSEISDIKTAVSEAVTNSIIHGYQNSTKGDVTLMCSYEGRSIYIDVIDNGKGISDIPKAMTPLYTSMPEMERSGLGFTVMEAFMDKLDVKSEEGKGTHVSMMKKLSERND